MIAIVAVLVVVSLSILATRLGALALEATGLSWEAARFQARSAFTGVGFTTNEAESVTDQPARRQVISSLMFLGNVGIVSIITSLVLGFSGTEFAQTWRRLAVLVGGLVLLTAFVRTHRFSVLVGGMLQRYLSRWSEIDLRDYVQLLRIAGDYAVREATVRERGWLAGRALRELDLPSEGILVLGVRRPDGSYLGAPGPDTVINPGDVVLFYGRDDNLDELAQRPQGSAGASAHERSARRHAQQQATEREYDERR